MIAPPEILAPAGNLTCVAAAINAGADAIYLGLGALNMRAGAKAGFTLNDLRQASELATPKGVKIYLTLNTIIFENELQEIRDLLTSAKPYINAAIVSDWAAIAACRELQIPIHISTQMSISNSESASFLKQMGAERIVLARECTLDEVAQIAQKSQIEIEAFVHGAMCVAVSGRCFMSHEAYGKSANRGECRQPCRRFYHVKEVREDINANAEFEVSGHTIFSARDLFSLPFLDHLIHAGVTSLKIEGRARSPEYVSTITAAYKTARDAVLNGTFTQDLITTLTKECSSVYHRDFGTGLYYGRPGKEQFVHDGTENLSPMRKLHLGIIQEYYRKTSTATLLLHNDELLPGDTLSIQGNKTGALKVTITALKEPRYGKGQIATINVPSPVIPGDTVYKLITI